VHLAACVESGARARVGHVFVIVDRLRGFSKARYRGLAKHASKAFTTLAMANIRLARKPLHDQVRASHGTRC
jgi:IS5 family transposase